MDIATLQHTARVLEDVSQAITAATNTSDPSPESLLAMAHVMGARNILTQLVRYLQLDSSDAMAQLLKDMEEDRARLALPEVRHTIQGEITTAMVAAKLIDYADTPGEVAQYGNIIVGALQSASDTLNGLAGRQLN